VTLVSMTRPTRPFRARLEDRTARTAGRSRSAPSVLPVLPGPPHPGGSRWGCFAQGAVQPPTGERWDTPGQVGRGWSTRADAVATASRGPRPSSPVPPVPPRPLYTFHVPPPFRDPPLSTGGPGGGRERRPLSPGPPTLAYPRRPLPTCSAGVQHTQNNRALVVLGCWISARLPARIARGSSNGLRIVSVPARPGADGTDNSALRAAAAVTPNCAPYGDFNPVGVVSRGISAAALRALPFVQHAAGYRRDTRGSSHRPSRPLAIHCALCNPSFPWCGNLNRTGANR
jgi:hypothetical protein